MFDSLRATAVFVFAIGVALPGLAQGADAEAGQAVFKAQCGICHSAVQGKTVMGPSMHGLIGQKSGTIEGFRYSAANKAADIVWSAATLDKYLLAPKEAIPGTTMSYIGLKDETKRADLIAYLETLK